MFVFNIAKKYFRATTLLELISKKVVENSTHLLNNQNLN